MTSRDVLERYGIVPTLDGIDTHLEAVVIQNFLSEANDEQFYFIGKLLKMDFDNSDVDNWLYQKWKNASAKKKILLSLILYQYWRDRKSFNENDVDIVNSIIRQNYFIEEKEQGLVNQWNIYDVFLELSSRLPRQYQSQSEYMKVLALLKNEQVDIYKKWNSRLSQNWSR